MQDVHGVEGMESPGLRGITLTSSWEGDGGNWKISCSTEVLCCSGCWHPLWKTIQDPIWSRPWTLYWWILGKPLLWKVKQSMAVAVEVPSAKDWQRPLKTGQEDLTGTCQVADSDCPCLFWSLPSISSCLRCPDLPSNSFCAASHCFLSHWSPSLYSWVLSGLFSLVNTWSRCCTDVGRLVPTLPSCWFHCCHFCFVVRLKWKKSNQQAGITSWAEVRKNWEIFQKVKKKKKKKNQVLWNKVINWNYKTLQVEATFKFFTWYSKTFWRIFFLAWRKWALTKAWLSLNRAQTSHSFYQRKHIQNKPSS